MLIEQAISMLFAARKNGAKRVHIGLRDKEGFQYEAPLEWIAVLPVGETAFVVPDYNRVEPLSNVAAEALDW